jgi:hypothetical protein
VNSCPSRFTIQSEIENLKSKLKSLLLAREAFRGGLRALLVPSS